MLGTAFADTRKPTSKPPPRTTPKPAGERSIETLEDEITTLSAHIGAAEYRLLAALGEFEARGGHVGIGIKSCAHWLNWKCGISLAAAHDKVRVAKALRELPCVSDAMARGALSYSKVRAITRVATPETESTLVDLARRSTASQLEEIVKRYRRMKEGRDAKDAAERQRRRRVRYHYDDDGMLELRATLPAEDGAVLVKALSAASEALWRASRGGDGEDETESLNKNSSAEDRVPGSSTRFTSQPRGYAASECLAARRADALVLMAETLLRRGAAELDAPDRHEVVVHIDAEALQIHAEHGSASVEDVAPLSFETVRRLTCDASIVPMVEDADGNPLHVGRRTRVVSSALRRALRSRDRGCRFPGCVNHHADAHHVEHWANGGATDIHNLVLLCRAHHRLVHEEGFSVRREDSSAFVFLLPNGEPLQPGNAWRVPAHDPVLALMQAQAPLAIDARTVVPRWFGERPDYRWIVGGLLQRDAQRSTA